jgi:hypothetical protein
VEQQVTTVIRPDSIRAVGTTAGTSSEEKRTERKKCSTGASPGGEERDGVRLHAAGSFSYPGQGPGLLPCIEAVSSSLRGEVAWGSRLPPTSIKASAFARGENVMGEGIVGLTRALQYAGARSVVAAQWPIADASTARLLVAFHRRLQAGDAKDEALRQAMTSVRQDPATAHPYHWSAFVLTGDPAPVHAAAPPSRAHR